MSAAVLIAGNTYPVKDALRALGGRWDAAAQGWRVPADKADAARKLVSEAPAQARASGYGGGGYRRRGGTCDDCCESRAATLHCWETGLPH